MREIKFRGKMLETGIWIYGCYTFSKKDSSRHVIWVQDENKELFVHTWPYAVDGNTIGQFTGLCDKNGKEIYEGDILECKNIFGGTLKWHYIVGRPLDFESSNLFLMTYEINFETDSDDGEAVYKNIGVWHKEEMRCDLPPFTKYGSDCYEVIGNIHDNPELLKGETK